MSQNIALQLVWVAAIFGLRKLDVPKQVKAPLWNAVLDIWDVLGHPPFPYKKP